MIDFSEIFSSDTVREQNPPDYPALMRYEGSRTDVHLFYFKILKRTPKGVWIEEFAPKPRFVNQTKKKQWAWSSKEDARASFLFRKRRQKAILEEQLERLNELIASVEKQWKTD